MTSNSYLQVIYNQFSTKSVITSERLGPASRKFVDGLRSYNKIKIKKELGKSTKKLVPASDMQLFFYQK